MFSDYPNIESRLQAQEGMSNILHARLYDIKTQMQTFERSVNERLDRFEQSVNEQFKVVDERFDKVDEQFKAVNERFNQFDQAVSTQFDHVYGEFADLKANVAELRNMVADNVEVRRMVADNIEIRNMLATVIAKLG